jgi:hypothetical protein
MLAAALEFLSGHQPLALFSATLDFAITSPLFPDFQRE